MPHEMRFNAVGPVCVEAVHAFASEIVEATALMPVVATMENAADVVFLDGSPVEMTLRIEWTHRRSVHPDFSSAWEGDEGPVGEGDPSDLPEHTCRHYTRTMVALARNAEAAGAFLGMRKNK